MSAAEIKLPSISLASMTVKPPSHPTYDLKDIIKLALAEDAGDRGSVRISFTLSVHGLLLGVGDIIPGFLVFKPFLKWSV